MDLRLRQAAARVALAALCWTVQAWPVAIVDGDTVDVIAEVRVTLRAPAGAIWLGERVEDVELALPRRERVRLLGVDAPEMTGATREAGERARAYTMRWLNGLEGQRAEPLWLTTCKRDSFGRVLGRIVRGTDDLSEDLIRAGHGVRREGK